MRVVLLHLGNMSQILPSTSLIKIIKDRIEKHSIKPEITFVLKEDDYCYINKYNKDVAETVSIDKFLDSRKKHDLLINLFPFVPEDERIVEKIRNFAGLHFEKGFDSFRDRWIHGRETSEMNIFQFYYTLAGLKWKGEGYDIKYFPKNRVKKKRVGISVANANLRNYILDKLELQNMKIWYIPFRKNIFKRMDEINRCEKIVTDDLTTFHLSMSLRKYVYFLETIPLKFKLEMFGSGRVHKVPSIVFQ